MVPIIFSPILLETSIVTELDPLTFAYDCLSSNVLLILAISLKVMTESPNVLMGVFKTSSVFSNNPGTLILKLPSPVSCPPAETIILFSLTVFIRT